MPRLDNAIDIRAPREKIFAYITDVESHPEWVKWTKRVELTSPDKGIGATDSHIMQVGPQKQRVDEIVTEYRDGQLFTRRHTRGLEMTDRLALVQLGDVTKVAWSVEYTPPMGPMGKMMDMMFMARLFDQLMKDSLELLRERLEGAR